MLHVRSIFPDQGRVEATSFELTPTNPQGEAVCSLFERYFCQRPPSFRDALSFLKRGDFELDWSAVNGGVALASLFQNQAPVCLAVLLTGINPDADSTMLEVFRETVLNPLFGCEFDDATTEASRPLLVQVLFPVSPEWIPAVQLLTVSMASVYFRTVLQTRTEAE